ncbi:MAG: class I SAM-dependent methyltransferase [Bacteroidales bacterium]|nr:class I SAM-dependent methyltransferase [Bacteroidales bacterium]MBN2820475.1 class I SAM-dependent methyltransferase [Bacteroidales bacterium]
MANFFVDLYCEFPTLVRKPMWRIWHKLLLLFDKDRTVNFMNYGYHSLNGEKPLDLKKEDETNRYCIQLYDHVVNRVSLENKKVVEVGSGRGGGAHYISRYYKPESYTGIDISTGVIKFCNNLYNVPGLSFKHGKAEKIPVENKSCDAVVNVESARCYSDIELFFREVKRILKNDGHFLFADMIEPTEVHNIRTKLINCGFRILKETEITKNVAKGLELDSLRRESLIKKKIPVGLKQAFGAFAAVKGTTRFDSFSNGKYQYWSFVLAH